MNAFVDACRPLNDGCVLTVPTEGPKKGKILPVIQSARIETKDSFNFKYGQREVKAKLPKGKWLWPAVWLLSAHDKYGKV
jgi:beta-glucanase (GH16 family)